MEDMSLSDGDEGITLQPDNPESGPVDVQLCLVGRFVTKRSIRTHIMKERLSEVWRPVKGVSIREATPGVFLFQFFHIMDLERVMKGGPWTFDNHLLVLGRMQVGVPLHDIPLFHTEFWVQAHNLPVGFMTEAVGKLLANYIGKFVGYDPTNNSCVWREYMRLRVLVDVRQPLKKERKVRVAGGEWSIVKFRYEKLAIFCFVCGCIGHTDQFCEVLFSKGRDDGFRGWSMELRAEARRGAGGGRSQWLKEGRPNPTEGGGVHHAATAETGHAEFQGGYAQNMHGIYEPSIRNKGKNIVEYVGPTCQNNSYAASGIDSRDPIPVGAFLLNNQGDPPSNQLTNEPYGEKKRRREGEVPVNEDTLRGGFVSVINNPLAESSHDNVKEHFLSAGPGHQACREK